MRMRTPVGTTQERRGEQFERHLLTGAASLTIVVRESGMLKALQSGEARGVPRHRIWLCLVLTGLFLYNPFLAGADSFGGLNLRHPPSNRATIGSSELQQFKVTDARFTFAIPETASMEFYACVRPTTEWVSEVFPQNAFLPQQFLCSSLWFRPPPGS
jgi:hypothetical protein